MPFQTSTNHYQLTKYIVDAVATDSCYNTIQSAIDAANAAGGNANIYIREGTYTENLTLYPNLTLWGDRGGGSIIVGTHIPPTTGRLEINCCFLQSATDIFNSAAAGTTVIQISTSIIQITNGYAFNLPNWTGTLLIDSCTQNSTNDGVINNTAGCEVRLINADVGAGNTNVMTLTGNANVRFDTCNINCPVNIRGTGTLTIQNGVTFANLVTIGGAKICSMNGIKFESTLTTTDTASVLIYNSNFVTGVIEAIIHQSANNLLLSEVSIDTSHNPCIDGTGVIRLGNVSFLQDKNFGIGVTQDFESCVARLTPYSVGFTGNFNTIQEAITAAAMIGVDAVVYIQPGTYTENLTLFSGIDLVGGVGIADSATCIINGVHTPPATGTVTIRNIYLQSATDILNSAAAGTTDIALIDCAIAVTNGYTFNLPNWTGSFTAFDVGELGSTNDGWINNTANATVFMSDSTMGNGIVNPCTISGNCIFFNVHVQCPVMFRSTGTTNINHSWFDETISTDDTATVNITNSSIVSGATTAILHNSANALTLSDLTINSTAVPVIDGLGAGNVIFGSITYLANNGVGVGLTKVYTTRLETGVLKLDDATNGILSATVGVVAGNATTNHSVQVGNAAGNLTSIAAGLTGELLGGNTGADPAFTQISNGDFTFTTNTSGATRTLTVRHTLDAGASNAALALSVGGSTSTGDPYINWLVTGAGTYTLGIDNSDSDYFKLTTGATPSAGTELFMINTANANFYPVALNHQIANVAGNVSTLTSNTDNTNIASHAYVAALTGGTSGGDPFFVTQVSGGAIYSFGIDNNDSDSFKLTDGLSPSAGTEIAEITTAGTVYLYGGLLYQERAWAGTGLLHEIHNTDNTNTASNASIYLWTGGASGGDPFFNLLIEGTRMYGFGIDNINADILRLYTRSDSLPCQPSTLAGPTQLWNMTSAGERIMPLQPAFLAYMSANQTNIALAGVTVQFNTEVFDQNADFNTGTYTFTAPVTGVYDLNAYVQLLDLDTVATYQLLITTSNRTYDNFINPSRFSADVVAWTMNLSTLADMDAADTAYIVVYQGGGAVQTDISAISGGILYSAFSGCLEC